MNTHIEPGTIIYTQTLSHRYNTHRVHTKTQGCNLEAKYKLYNILWPTEQRDWLPLFICFVWFCCPCELSKYACSQPIPIDVCNGRDVYVCR